MTELFNHTHNVLQDFAKALFKGDWDGFGTATTTQTPLCGLFTKDKSRHVPTATLQIDFYDNLSPFDRLWDRII